LFGTVPLTDPDPTVGELIAARPHLRMHALDGLVFEDVPLNAIVDALGTPVWAYGARTMRGRLAALNAALAGLGARIHYAVKANDHLAVLRLLGRGGAGADVVSGGELARALRVGIPAARIVFSGVGKTTAEIEAALAAGISQFNVESAGELDAIAEVATAMGREAPVALRVNPDIDAGTHPKIATGRAGDKFGIAYGDTQSLYARAASLPGIRPVGLALHIGSQILTLAPYRAAFARAAALVRTLRAAGHAVARMDCGGGLGIGYRDPTEAVPVAFAGALRAAFTGMDLELLIEPGRWLVGPAGVLLATVVRVKDGWVVLDAAMNDLVRPAMYEAWHGIVPLGPVRADAAPVPLDIVGPVCESGDTFARGRLLPPLAEGDRVAILDAGAYGAVMSSTYNARPLAPIALIDGARWATIRPRQPLEALWHGECVPDFLDDGPGAS
jgi:diaminopimelate decarboxylase